MEHWFFRHRAVCLHGVWCAAVKEADFVHRHSSGVSTVVQWTVVVAEAKLEGVTMATDTNLHFGPSAIGGGVGVDGIKKVQVAKFNVEDVRTNDWVVAR